MVKLPRVLPDLFCCPGFFEAENIKRAQENNLTNRAVHKLEKRAEQYVSNIVSTVGKIGEIVNVNRDSLIEGK